MLRASIPLLSIARLSTLVVLFLLCSCGESLDDAVKEAVRDKMISAEEWQGLLEKAKDLKEFKEDGEFSPSMLKNYVEKYAKENMRGIDSVSFDENIEGGMKTCDEASALTTVKFFLERSGSMVPYDSPKTKGEFKTALIYLLNALPTGAGLQDGMIYIVNDGVYPYNVNFRDFIRTKDLFGDTKSVGNPHFTDFTCIFDSLLNHTAADEMSIFVSDMIYSTKELANANPEKIMAEAEGLTTSIFKDHNDKDVLIMKMEADYDGNYYPFNSPSKGTYYSGDRPYYIMIVASPAVLKYILTSDDYREFRNFKAIKGFEEFYCFTRSTATPDYSILLSDKNNRGRFRAQKGQKQQIHKIEDFEPDRSGESTFMIAVDLSTVPIPESMKTDSENYYVESQAGFSISEIVPVKNLTDEIKRRVPGTTHLMSVTTHDDIKNETVRISLKNELPEWIRDSNTDDDRNTASEDFAETTFAFEHLMNGIYRAYHPTSETPMYFTLDFSIRK